MQRPEVDRVSGPHPMLRGKPEEPCGPHDVEQDESQHASPQADELQLRGIGADTDLLQKRWSCDVQDFSRQEPSVG